MKKNERVDLFRYGIIAPLITGDAKRINSFCREASQKQYYYKGKSYKFSADTIKKWYYKYKNKGFDDLINKERRDKSSSRKLSEEVINYIIDLRSKFPKMTTKSIYDKLLLERFITEDISIQCFYRYIQTNDLKRDIVMRQERRRYEKQHPNDTWQADTTYGPYIKVDGKKYRTYLIHFIDDNSRLVVGHGFFFNDNAINVQKVFKKAIETYGLPKQIYLDNGKSYKNNQLEIICARLGIKLTNTHTYDPEAKGKVERCFRTIKEGWMNNVDWNQFDTIDDLEKNYNEYLYSNYINKVHSELKDTPNNVWHKGIKDTIHKRIKNDKLEEIFMNTIQRKVSNDRIVTINNKLYEVPYKYVGQTIELRYYVEDINEIWIYEKNERKEKCNRLNKRDNSEVKRQSNIDYSKLVNNEEDVLEMGEE